MSSHNLSGCGIRNVRYEYHENSKRGTLCLDGTSAPAASLQVPWSSVCMAPAAQQKPGPPTAAVSVAPPAPPPASLAGLKRAMRASANLILHTACISIVGADGRRRAIDDVAPGGADAAACAHSCRRRSGRHP
eukprot:6200259-Pleurochrysis_carterae.AAC.1